MWVSPARSIRMGAFAVLSLAFLLIAASPLPPAQANAAASSEIVLTLDPAQSKVHWTVDSTLHTVHGTFALKNGSVHFDPETGVAGGEIVVYAPSGQSGSGSRDKRMQREID